jgi:hypothetical protein
MQRGEPVDDLVPGLDTLEKRESAGLTYVAA